MHYVRKMIRAVDEAREARREVVLATVVRVVGSAYRKPGARMLITGGSEGQTVGTLSGGCLEKDVAMRASQTIESGQAQLLSYSTSGSNDDLVFGVGQGCNGRVDILVERLNIHRTSAADPLLHVYECLIRREAGVLVTIIRNGGTEAPLGSALSLRKNTLA